jgi:hypothetical protein
MYFLCQVIDLKKPHPEIIVSIKSTLPHHLQLISQHNPLSQRPTFFKKR